MAQAELYSTKQGKVIPFDLDVDHNGEIVAENKKSGESLKFPAGLTKSEFNQLVKAHNQANEGVVARSPEEMKKEEEALERSKKLLEDL